MRVRSRLLLPVLAVLAVGALHVPGTARADGDPASDTLLLQTLYTPVAQKISPNVLAGLESTIAASNKAGAPIRVALILDRTDLGAVPQLFGHPTQYVHLLASELVFGWKKTVIAVQPSGIGVRNITPLAPAQKLMDGITVAKPATADGLALAAETAIRKLAAARGKTLPGTTTSATGGSSSSSSSTTWIIVGVAIAVVVLLGAGLTALRLRKPKPVRDE